jgi:hypothetical protein
MQKSTQQPSNYHERNADDGENSVDARRGWRLQAAAEGRWDFRLPALPHADDHQQDNYPDGTKEHHKRHRNQIMGQRGRPDIRRSAICCNGSCLGAHFVRFREI